MFMQNKEQLKAPLAGIGSFFHEEEAFNHHTLDIGVFTQNHHQLFYTGRQALLYLIQMISETAPIAHIWLPEYYCKHVTAWLEENLNNIKYYTIDPFEQKGSLNFEEIAAPNDIVLLNNYWGVFEYDIQRKKNSPIYIEDHTHGWLSESCTKSNADYCFASLRKSLPVPLGGICWKPNGALTAPTRPLQEDESFYPIWEKSKRAMNLKSTYIEGHDDTAPNQFLDLFGDTESGLNANFNVVAMKPEHKSHIEKYLNADILIYKKKNSTRLFEQLKTNAHFQVLHHPEKTSFGLHVLFKDEATFQDFRAYLIQNKIYPSTLWPGNKKLGPWHYLLNIHIDYRYSEEDMDYLALCINTWRPQSHLFN